MIFPISNKVLFQRESMAAWVALVPHGQRYNEIQCVYPLLVLTLQSTSSRCIGMHGVIPTDTPIRGVSMSRGRHRYGVNLHYLVRVPVSHITSFRKHEFVDTVIKTPS